MKVVWPTSTLARLRSIRTYIATDNPDAARRVFRSIKSSADRLAEYPQMGRPGTVLGTRELVIPNMPYVLVYRVVVNEIQILRVFHTSMDWSATFQ